eukprot:g64535.t1
MIKCGEWRHGVVAQCTTRWVSLDSGIEHPACVLYTVLFYALGTNLAVFESSTDIPSITPAAPGQQSFRHEHARKLSTFTSTWVISCMFTRLSRLSAEVFMDADSIEIGTSAAPASWPPAVLAPPLEAVA